MKRLLIPLLLLLVLAGAAWFTNGFGLMGDGAADGTLTLQGNVDVREVEMAFRVGGRIASIAVDEGDRVAPGDLLAVLDGAPVADRARQGDAGIAQAEADLARLANGARAQEIAAAAARVDAAQAQAAQARADLARRQPLADAGAISRNQWEDTQAAARMAEAQLREARAALALLNEGTRAEDISAARARLDGARAARAATATDLADTRLTAAGEGIVSTRSAEPGSLVQPGEAVLTIAIDRPLRVRAYVAESDLSRVRPGMKVQVRADGSDTVYQGTVGFVSPRAEFTPRTVETEDLRTDLVYRVRIIIANPDDGLRQGQPVTVEVPEAAPAR